LKRVIAKAADMGLELFSGFEYEFFVFNETAQSVREKNYQNMQPMAPAEFGYSVIRNSVGSDTYQNLLNLSETMDFSIEGLHEETGPGVLEAALVYSEALQSADKASLFKTFTKVALQKENKIATFMARWSPDYPGQSGHIHISIKDKNGKALFHDDSQVDGVSEVMKYFAAGQQQLMPELLAMIAPTVNSYRRLIPGFWAPTEASVGIDNRTCAIRLIPGSEKSQRLEFRIAAADANPYIILAAAIASGLWGIENKAKIEALVKGNAYDQQFPEHLKLPSTLWDAAQRFKASTIAREFFGDEFVDHFAASREWEEREYRKHISQWELERYFEII
jgi:glutamine synthetase